MSLLSASVSPATPLSPTPKVSSYPIIVHSHLRWDWVWQRPQQFLSRLAKKHRILFVEGPDFQNVEQRAANFPR